MASLDIQLEFQHFGKLYDVQNKSKPTFKNSQYIDIYI